VSVIFSLCDVFEAVVYTTASLSSVEYNAVDLFLFSAQLVLKIPKNSNALKFILEVYILVSILLFFL